MQHRQNPVLSKLYSHLGEEQVVAYLDETFDSTRPSDDEKRGEAPGFYTMRAAIYRGREITDVREDLRGIVGSSHWHSTDAVQTPEGREIFTRLLDYFHDHDDVSLLVTQVPLESTHENQRLEARSNCLRHLVSQLSDGVKDLRAVIFERSNKGANDNRDRRDFKELRASKRIPTYIQHLHASPSDENLLWAPDIVAFAYRRGLTHRDDSSQWFDRISEHSHVTVLDGTELPATLPPISQSAKGFLDSRKFS
ncbi:MAG: hypothetical protein Q4G50_02490 [Corynebacterium sp.]|nr:hypothetical protein [Corynebacterium sp.]